MALEILSDNIYDFDVEVSDAQQAEILSLSKHYGVDENYHKFIGRKPHPDLRTAEQKAFDQTKFTPSLENIEFLAASGFFIDAVKVHREMFDTNLETAVEKVKQLITEK